MYLFIFLFRKVCFPVSYDPSLSIIVPLDGRYHYQPPPQKQTQELVHPSLYTEPVEKKSEEEKENLEEQELIGSSDNSTDTDRFSSESSAESSPSDTSSDIPLPLSIFNNDFMSKPGGRKHGIIYDDNDDNSDNDDEKDTSTTSDDSESLCKPTNRKRGKTGTYTTTDSLSPDSHIQGIIIPQTNTVFNPSISSDYPIPDSQSKPVSLPQKICFYSSSLQTKNNQKETSNDKADTQNKNNNRSLYEELRMVQLKLMRKYNLRSGTQTDQFNFFFDENNNDQQ